jgi:hypothetical protein
MLLTELTNYQIRSIRPTVVYQYDLADLKVRSSGRS